MGEQRLDGRIDEAQVGGVPAGDLRRADREEVHVAAARHPPCSLLNRRRPEARPSRSSSASCGSKNGAVPRRERRDLALVDVDPDDVVSDRGHGCGVHGTEVPASDH